MFIDKDNRLVGARIGVGVGKMGKGSQKVQFCTCQSWGCNE